MGDRTWLQLDVPKGNVAAVHDLFGYEAEEIDESPYSKNAKRLEYSEINYGGYSELENLVALGISFLAYSGDGGSYDSSISAFDGFDRIDAITTSHSGQPMIEVSEHGIESKTLKNAIEYFAVKERTIEAFNNYQIIGDQSCEKGKA